MPKVKDGHYEDQPFKQKVPRRKVERYEEFTRDSSKRNKRNKKRPSKT